MPDGLFISVGKRDYHLPFSSAPWFKNARVPDIFNVEMLGDDAIRWDALDVDLEIECLEYPERYPLIMKLTPDEVL
jgi:hypothetical protein